MKSTPLVQAPQARAVTLTPLEPRRTPARFDLPIRPAIRGQVAVGFVIIAALVGTFGYWSWAAPLSSAAISSGQVMAAGNRRIVQHLEGGIVREFLVQDGAAVESGQVLLRLDDAQSGAQAALLRTQWDAMRALDARLSAELAEAPAITFPSDLVAGRDDPRLAETIASQERLFISRRRAQEGQLSIFRQRIAQLNAEIKGLDGVVTGFQSQATLLSREAKDVEGLVEQGYVPRPRLLALQRELARVTGERERTAGQIARSRQTIGETELQMTQLRNSFRNEVTTEQRDTRQRMAETDERMRAAADVQQRREVTAPVAGIVTNLRFHTVGGVVRPGDALLDIVPRNEALVIEARVATTDIDIVTVGQQADVRLTAFRQRVVPLLRGRVTYVAADITAGERQDIPPYYRATVEIDPGQLALVPGVTLTPGMPAEVMIHAGERTLAEYLIDPIRDSFRRAFREP
jgi:HlyD family secretion protein